MNRNFEQRGLAILSLCLFIISASARQIRINRFGKEIVIDVRNSSAIDAVDDASSNNTAPEIPATVRELNPTAYPPYPAAGYRPSRAFNLPGEEDDDDAARIASTTTTTLSPDTTTTTATTTESISTTTTTLYDLTTTTENDLQNDDDNDDKTPYPPAGYRPDRAFNLPTENQESQSATVRSAPYPPAGYRPSREFLLPNEIQSAALKAAAAAPESSTEKSPDNSNHPVCGVSIDPLRPKPAPNSKDEPDAERILIRGVVIQQQPSPSPSSSSSASSSASSSSSSSAAEETTAAEDATATAVELNNLVQYQALMAQPFIIPARPFAYTAQFQTW